MTKAKVSELIAQARALTEPDQVVALATSYGHHGVGVGHYCEFYIAPANRLVSAGHANRGRAIMQAGQDKGHITWLQRAAWEDFVKYTEKLLASNSTTNEEDRMFTDTKFMTAKDKELTLKAWRTFLKHGCQRKHFTKRLYHHLIQHCSFIAHYNIHGFHDHYFTDPNKTKRFISQFDTGESIEYGRATWWLTGEYEDINRAMCQVIGLYKADLYAECSSAEFKRDTGIITALMAKHGLANVLAVEAGYRFS